MSFCDGETVLTLRPDKQWGNILAKDKEEECVFPLVVLEMISASSKCQLKLPGKPTILHGPCCRRLTSSPSCLLGTGGGLLSFQTDRWLTDYRSPWVAAICYLGHINRTYRKKRVVPLDVWVPPPTSSFLVAPGSSTCRRGWAGEVLNGTRAGLSFSTAAVSSVTWLS